MRRRHLLRSFALLLLVALAVAIGACSGAPDGESVGTRSSQTFANDHTSFDYFVAKGLTPFQAAGIVGNLDQESGDDPTAVQPGGPGRGLAQWSAGGGRWDSGGTDSLSWYASAHGGVSVWDYHIQLDFIWYELTTFGYGFSDLKATTNVTDATLVFMTKFEICGTCASTARINYAKDVLAAYGTTPDYAAQFVSQSFPLASTTMTMSEGEVVPSYIELKNVGAKTWDSNTRIGTTMARDRVSKFADATWVNDHRLAAVKGTVPPGSSYKFTFDLAAPDAAGSYDEHFGVVQEGVAWFSDPGQGGPPDGDLEVKIDVVVPDWRAVFKDQSFPLAPAALTVHQGDVAKGYIELTNKGAKTWKAGVTKLATAPRDATSPLADPSWLSPTRVATITADVPPDGVGRFDFALDTKSIGDTTLKLGLVEEGVAWFSDPGQGGPADGFLQVHLVVVSKDTSIDAGPTSDGGTTHDAGASGDGATIDAPSEETGSSQASLDDAKGGCDLGARGASSSFCAAFAGLLVVGALGARKRRAR